MSRRARRLTFFVVWSALGACSSAAPPSDGVMHEAMSTPDITIHGEQDVLHRASEAHG